MTLAERFPDLYRYLRSEAGPIRLIAGFFTANFICLCIFVALGEMKERWSILFHSVLWLQMLPILIFGTLRATGSIFQERAERTWDFQRLTPLTSFEITFGKLFGAPIFAYFLFFSMLPWTFLAAFASPEIPWGMVYEKYRLPVAIAFFCLNLGLLVSAHSMEGKQGRFVNASGAFIGLMAALQWASGGVLLQLMQKFSPNQTVSFWGIRFTPEGFTLFTLFSFGIWAFFGAKWRIGEDLLERRPFWRFPAFLIFYAWYSLGIEAGVNPTGNLAAAMANQPPPTPPTPEAANLLAHAQIVLMLSYLAGFVYVAAFLWPERADYWRRWLRSRGLSSGLDQAPIWVLGYAAVLLTAAVLAALSRLGIYGVWNRFLVLLPIFLGRDLFFLQWCRFTRSRRADGMALVYLTLAYALPPLLLFPFHPEDKIYLFAPYPQPGTGFLLNIFPGLIQFVSVAAVALFRLSRSPSVSIERGDVP